MSQGWLVLMTAIVMFPLVLISTIMPFLTRRIESFGVTVPEQAQKDSRLAALRSQYVWWNGAAGVALSASLVLLSLSGMNEERWSLVMMGHVFGYLILSFLLYLKQHRAVKRIKQQENWLTDKVQRVIVNTKFRQEKLTVSYLWFIPHFLLIVSFVLIGLLGYDQFPDRIPMKHDFEGNITRTVEKSYSAVMWPAIIGSFVLLVFIFVNYSIGRSKQIVESSDPDGSLRRNVKFRRYWSSFVVVNAFLMIAMFGSFQLYQLLDWDIRVPSVLVLVVTGIIVVGSIVLSIVTGQGGSRIGGGVGDADGKAAAAAGDQDQHWKLGQFYFNPKDPAIFVEKRFGVGWTMNFARPLGWLILIGIIAVPLLLAWLLG
ncbi:DUF5808 domain-containing protein [Paenibacillus sp. J5C_2022]|uniref:DUF1648 domain-containing protein n=1 Tax=Paenibacillus sp. J5C2022 TaxID=2977129 RepID=UPI0021CECCFB|nr:DUF5808 domain-containing protein [Paenibacillus sp. J5C2022]MCU6712469.1 DUF5808 domain-containing protein [Paenibacillus sp. J5C2022]